jgi:C1A family cysteine protease
MKALLVLALFAAAASALTVTSTNVEHVFKFTAWMEQYDKSYTTATAYDHAFHNFVQSLARAAKRNTHGGKTQWGLTKFSDLSPAEFAKIYLGSHPANSTKVAKVRGAPLGGAAPPSKFDWRTHGQTVTPVKDQGQCGSCWAFSTIENLESMYYLKTKDSQILSEQELVDCDPQSQGCGGGWTYWAWEYLSNAGGDETESSYPYKAVNQPCKFSSGKIKAHVHDYKYAIPACKAGPCPSQDEKALQAAVAKIGPMSVCVNAQTWNDYQGGVIQGSDCSGDAGGIDHCVQLVGYDWDQGYWIVRNSWNTNWGDNGYIYLQTGTNTCAVADVVTYGVV